MNLLIAQLSLPDEGGSEVPFLIKAFIVLFLLAWSVSGIWLLANGSRIFGSQRGLHESQAARALSSAQAAAIWFGFFAIAVYFLFL